MLTEQPTNDAIRTIALTGREVWLVRSALEEYLAIFGHRQGALVHEIKALLQSLSPVK